MSTIKTNTLQNVAGTLSVPVDTVVQGSAKAWVNFNGTGTVAIRAAFNVSSITDNGTGDYTVNFTTAMADANYAAFGFSNWDGTNRGSLVGLNNLRTKANTSVPISTQQSSSYTLMDCSEVFVTIFR